ncbi:hypothetical protein [Mesorhizobium sp. C386A]
MIDPKGTDAAAMFGRPLSQNGVDEQKCPKVDVFRATLAFRDYWR